MFQASILDSLTSRSLHSARKHFYYIKPLRIDPIRIAMGKSKKGKQRLVGMDEPLEYTTSCPFCVIASAFPPILPSRFANEKANPDILDPPSHVVLSTPHVMAFFDIMPITRGHVLVCPRDHRVKMSDISTFQGSEVSTPSSDYFDFFSPPSK